MIFSGLLQIDQNQKRSNNQEKLLNNQNIQKSQTLLTQNQLLQEIQKKVSRISGACKNSNNSLYSETTKTEDFFDEKKNFKKTKTRKKFHSHKGLNPFNPELRFKGA